ncbi:MAG: TIM barrel protein [Gammaproteobacteria bacterium]
MKLKLFKTLWGFEGGYDEAADQAAEAGFDGLEGPPPTTPKGQDAFAAAMAEHALEYIAEIRTAGGYVPDRGADVARHLATLEDGLQACRDLRPLFVTCIGGCDAWSEPVSIEFFSEAMALADRYGLAISFETHRSRSLFNPWTTERLVAAVPGLELTADFSHWCVVCERLLDTELETIEAIAPRVRHIHARVGYDQGPQVPHPAAPEYASALAAHQGWWETVWRAQTERGLEATTMTPEFGPDGYLHLLPFTQAPIADLWDINRWMGGTERAHFARWRGPDGARPVGIPDPTP